MRETTTTIAVRPVDLGLLDHTFKLGETRLPTPKELPAVAAFMTFLKVRLGDGA